jgi:Tetratricopeptide repeat
VRRVSSEKLNKRKAVALLAQAQLHQQKGEPDKVAQLLEPVVFQSDLASAELYGALADAHLQCDRFDEAERVLAAGSERYGRAPELTVRKGALLIRLDRASEALVYLEQARPRLGKEPGFHMYLAQAYLGLNRLEDAEAEAGHALTHGGGDEARYLTALVKGRRGKYPEAQALAMQLGQSKQKSMVQKALALEADVRLFQGDGKGALAAWKKLEARGGLLPMHLGHMAYAAELAGDSALADALVARRQNEGPSGEDLLLFAHIHNLRGQAVEALADLDAASRESGERAPGYAFEVLAAQGRAYRLLGRGHEAKAALQRAKAMPEASSGRLGPRLHVDSAHLLAEEGAFEDAEAELKKALALDPEDPEARKALELTQRRVAWKTELKASADARLEAMKAETEALRRRFASREGELEALRKELEALKASQADAEAASRAGEVKKRKAEEAAREEQEKRLRDELVQRETDADAKAAENLERSMGSVKERCPPQLWALLLVAERTYQKALYTELPAAAVAVLFSGALERALYSFFVEAFDRWLDERGEREAFLKGAVREKRGKRVEYFDHFAEAFEKGRAGRAPAMGEVGRVLERRHESYLKPFSSFLGATYGAPDAFYKELAEFVAWSKEKFRDPVAHGRGIELGYDELKLFRERLLFDFGKRKRGALAVLLSKST